MYDNIPYENLTSQQRANLKYYLKKKNDPNYIKRINEANNKHYHKIKNNEDFKMSQSIYKKEYYKRIKNECIDFTPLPIFY